MKIILPIEEGYFHINPCEFCDIDAYLIVPEIDAKWNKSNLHFRSLIADKEGNVLSCGFPKFFNLGEKTECYPAPETFNDWKIDEKIDGSLLIADYVNQQFSMRTRGTSTYKKQNNAKDFELLPQKLPKVVNFLKQNKHLSLLFEIVTPNNIIVIRPKDIQFYLIGAVNKDNLKLLTTTELLEVWRSIGSPLTPEQYYFDNLKDISKISNFIKTWKGKEGVILSYNNGQNKVKIKSDWYCFIHRVKSQLCSIDNLIEYYIENGMPLYDEFFKKIETNFDYEIAEQLKDEILKITKAGENTNKAIFNMKDFVNSIRSFETRKQQAEHIIATYQQSNRAPFVFHLLDGKELSNIQLFKLIKQFITED